IDSLTQGHRSSALLHHPAVVSLELPAPPPAQPGPGTVYTPPVVANALATRVLAIAEQGPIADPACGCGALLVAAVRTAPDASLRAQIVRRTWGCDLDPGAIAVCRIALGLTVLEVGGSAELARQAARAAHLQVLDGLRADWPPSAAVLMNPPYEDAACMSRRDATERERISSLFSVCRGNWDLWCAFVEKALISAQPHAPVGLLLPDKLLQAPYAEAVRQWLAHARPSLIRLGRVTEAKIDLVQLVARGGAAPAADGSPWVDEVHAGAGEPELSHVAEVLNAATVAEAYQIADGLIEKADPSGDDLRLITTGAIDPFRHTWGVKPQRYLKRRWLHPVLTADALPNLERRLLRMRRPKIILAGLCTRLEAVVDTDGTLLPAKSTVVVVPHRIEDLHPIADALNSAVVTARWRAGSSGLALSGGYLRVTKDRLLQLRIPLP
ncbi:MAG: N-6 DNA methylase, partial [Myxococcota bacterium]